MPPVDAPPGPMAMAVSLLCHGRLESGVDANARCQARGGELQRHSEEYMSEETRTQPEILRTRPWADRTLVL